MGDKFIETKDPSIEYLELYGLTAALLTWGEFIHDIRVLVFCDNQAVVSMVNNLTSSCKNCMFLLRLITLNNLVNNRRVFVQYIRSSDNELPDALSRLQFSRFWETGSQVHGKGTVQNIPPNLACFANLDRLISILERIKRRKNRQDKASSTTSSISTRDMELIVDRLSMDRNRSSTRETYHRIWKLFNHFFLKLDRKPDTWKRGSSSS